MPVILGTPQAAGRRLTGHRARLLVKLLTVSKRQALDEWRRQSPSPNEANVIEARTLHVLASIPYDDRS
jgi:hypothetical protein